jgi:hypothetical protein
MPNLDLDLAKYSRNELLHQSVDRAVLGGRMRIEAAKDCLDMYSDKCVVDEKTLQITLNGLPLDAALEKIIAQRPLWQPTGDDPAVKERSELEAAALAGSVTAHGALWKSLGTVAYEAWKKKHLAAPGRKAAGDAAAEAAAAAAGEDPGLRSTNPFYRLRKPDGSIDKAVEAQVGGMISAMGHKKVTDIARAAKSPTAPLGLSLTGLPLKA